MRSFFPLNENGIEIVCWKVDVNLIRFEPIMVVLNTTLHKRERTVKKVFFEEYKRDPKTFHNDGIFAG